MVSSSPTFGAAAMIPAAFAASSTAATIDTTAPFLVSLPMTTIDGTDWNYDVAVYPKNETDSPDLEKTLRESKDDTGKNNGTANDTTDGYAHTAPATAL